LRPGQYAWVEGGALNALTVSREIRRLMLSSIEATWLSADRKKRLAADFERDPGWNEAGA